MDKTKIPIPLHYVGEVLFIDDDPYSPYFNVPYQFGVDKITEYKTGNVIYVNKTSIFLYRDCEGRWNYLPEDFLIYLGLMTLDERWQ